MKQLWPALLRWALLHFPDRPASRLASGFALCRHFGWFVGVTAHADRHSSNIRIGTWPERGARWRVGVRVAVSFSTGAAAANRVSCMRVVVAINLWHAGPRIAIYGRPALVGPWILDLDEHAAAQLARCSKFLPRH